MKIEKINDNQIRCTLTQEDLAKRNIKLSELAYGNEKAQALFKDMMAQAAEEYGFDTDDAPLMIEAVPLPSNSIILIISKVDFPDELDTRFSQFSEEGFVESNSIPDFDEKPATAANEIIELFNKAQKEGGDGSVLAGASNLVDISKLYVFANLENVIRLSKILKDSYHGQNILYKNPKDDKFYLIVSKSDHSPEEFNKICNIITEYGAQADFSVGQSSYYQEHYKIIIAQNALSILAQL